MSKSCPICGSSTLHSFVEFPAVPVSGAFCAEQNQSVPQRDLNFDYCPSCSFVSQRVNPAGVIDYAGVARPTARQLPAYAGAIVERLLQAGREGLVVEVGCNDGTFLNELRRVGFNKLLGIEPSLALATHVRKQGHEVVQKPLDLELAEELLTSTGSASIVVCRHTLEHVPQPMAFLTALRSLLKPGGLACIEVPSLRPIIEYVHVHELWDEHVSYFLPETLSLALNAAGFSIESIVVEPYREMENIVVWARAAEPDVQAPHTPARYASLCAKFNPRWQAARTALLAALEASPKPIVALGASHPQSNFLNFSGASAYLSSVIDDDPHKLGQWLPLKGGSVPILPSSALTSAVSGGTLLLSGFGYPQWMNAAREQVATHAQVVIDVSELIFSLSEEHDNAS